MEPDVERIHANYALGANASVRARFAVYDLCEFPVNLNYIAPALLHSIGKLTVESAIMDGGAADGELLDFTRIVLGHRGLAVGIDPNSGQFKERTDYNDLTISTPEWSRFNRMARKRHETGLSHIAELEAAGTHRPLLPDSAPLLQQGVIQDLSRYGNETFDVNFQMFVKYHARKAERARAVQEAHRVEKDGAAHVEATSGTDNKPVHRSLEESIAEHIGAEPPAPMAAPYTTETMLNELAANYRHVYLADYQSRILVMSTADAKVYLKSLRSMRNQFVPEPTPEAYEEALAAVVLPRIRKERYEKGAFIDYAHRSLAIASDTALPGLLEHHLRQVA
jgi:hypothetical protein